MSNPNDHGANLMHVDSHHVNFRSTSTGTGVGTGFSISRIRSAVVSFFSTGTSTGTSILPGSVRIDSRIGHGKIIFEVRY